MSEKSGLRKNVLIASTIKTVKDTRAWGKLGSSLRETQKYQLNFLGFSKEAADTTGEEKYFPSTSAHTKWGRISAQLKFLKTLISVRPQLVICCTYEYLPIATFCKQFLKYKLIYDVQENYISNLELNPNLSPSKRRKLAKLISYCESRSGVDLYLLAEKCYLQEMPEKSPFLILENKFAGEIKPMRPRKFSSEKTDFRFLISGTLTPAYGILEAVNWFKKIHLNYPNSRLKIIGHCTLKSFQKSLEKHCHSEENIEVISAEHPLPYEQILRTYQEADFALLPYRNLPQLWEKMPTKLYEAAALGVPALIPSNPKWITFLHPFQGGYTVDFLNPDTAAAQLEQALNQHFFTQPVPAEVAWSSQHTAFIQALDKL